MNKNITVVSDEDWEHGDNCKVCQLVSWEEQHLEEPQDQISPERPSPGVVKRKETVDVKGETICYLQLL